MWMDDDFQFELPNWIIQSNWTTHHIYPPHQQLLKLSHISVIALKRIHKIHSYSYSASTTSERFVIEMQSTTNPPPNMNSSWHKKVLLCNLPRSQGATHSSLSACLMMVSGRGRECLTMAPYRPYSAMILPRPQVLLVFLSLALLFWNQTWKPKIRFKNIYNALKTCRVLKPLSPFKILTNPPPSLSLVKCV